MKKLLLPALAILASVAGCAQIHDGATRASSMTDPANFTTQTAAERTTEEAMTRLAVQRAKSDDVKQFAVHLLADDQANDRLLQALASQAGVALSTEVPAAAQAKLEELARLPHSEFDRAYMDAIVTAKRDDLHSMEVAQRALAPAVAQFARNSLPTLRTDLVQAETVNVLVGAGMSDSHED